MDADEALSNIRNHGECVEHNRVKCKYCGKTMTTFSRLKCHLGGVGTDVRSCETVPEDVKEVFRKMVLEKDASGKKSGRKSLTSLPQKRSLSRNLNGIKHSKIGAIQVAGSASGNSDGMNSVVDCETTEDNLAPNGRTGNVEFEKSVGKFFYENGVDFSVASSPSFRKMISAAAALGISQANVKIPTPQELGERIFRDEVLEMQEYVKTIKESWATTGCSLLLDWWVGKDNRHFVCFIVECPKGPVYLGSADVSNIVNDVDAILLLLDGAMQEIGITNLVQVVASSSTGWIAAVRDRFMQQGTPVIWSISASNCIKLMLERISCLPYIKRALDGAKAIVTFIYSHGEILNLMKYHTGDKDLLDTSWMEFAVPFFTLEKVTSEKENLEKMFASYDWMTSVWACRGEGKKVGDLMSDLTFWAAAEIALNSSIPLLKVYDIVNQTDKPFVGYIYETIDQAKETIKEELKGITHQYQPVWDVIDDVWDNHLHSILHGAGYYLNPVIYYSDDFYQDEEVFIGLLCCLVRMVRDKHVELLITLQLDKYRTRQGAFEEGSAFEKIKNITPVEWWSIYGNQCPELQSFAIRVLSQTCDGASRYRLDRTFAEKLLLNENAAEQRGLIELTTLHYNLHLRNCKAGTSSKIKAEEAD